MLSPPSQIRAVRRALSRAFSLSAVVLFLVFVAFGFCRTVAFGCFWFSHGGFWLFLVFVARWLLVVFVARWLLVFVARWLFGFFRGFWLFLVFVAIGYEMALKKYLLLSVSRYRKFPSSLKFTRKSFGK